TEYQSLGIAGPGELNVQPKSTAASARTRRGAPDSVVLSKYSPRRPGVTRAESTCESGPAGTTTYSGDRRPGPGAYRIVVPLPARARTPSRIVIGWIPLPL